MKPNSLTYKPFVELQIIMNIYLIHTYYIVYQDWFSVWTESGEVDPNSFHPAEKSIVL